MMRTPRRLQASVEYMVLGDLAQCVLSALWRAGHVQRFNSLGSLSARGAVLVRLRQLGLFQRPGAEAAFDGVLEELLAAGALTADGDALVLPILSADKLREPRPTPQPLTPDEAQAAAQAARERDTFERAYRAWRTKARAAGDLRLDEELRTHYREQVYRPRGAYGRNSETAPANSGHAAVIGRNSTPANTATNSATPSRNSDLSLPLPGEKSLEREERREREPRAGEAPLPPNTAAEFAPAPTTPEAPSFQGSDNQAPRIPSPRIPRGTTGIRDDAPAPAAPAPSAPSPADPSPALDTAPEQAVTRELSDEELGRLGLEGLARGGERFDRAAPHAQVLELGAWMRAASVPPEQLADAGRFLATLKVAERYAWDTTVSARGAVTLAFLLGKRVATGGREGQRLHELVRDARAAAARSRGHHPQHQLPLPSGTRASTAAPAKAALTPVAVKAVERAEAETARASGEAPRIKDRPAWARAGGPAGEGGAETG